MRRVVRRRGVRRGKRATGSVRGQHCSVRIVCIWITSRKNHVAMKRQSETERERERVRERERQRESEREESGHV